MSTATPPPTSNLNNTSTNSSDSSSSNFNDTSANSSDSSSPNLNGTSANSTDSSSSWPGNTKSMGIVMSIFGFVMLIIISVLIYCHFKNEFDKRRDSKKREAEASKKMIKLDKAAPSQNFKDWREKYESKSDDTFAAQQADCVICLGPLGADQDIREVFCHHVFHKGCLDSWYMAGHVGCPLCKAVFIQETLTKGQELAVANAV